MERERTDWDRIVEELWQEEAQMQKTMPRPRTVRVMPDTFAGINPGELYKPDIYQNVFMHDVEEYVKFHEGIQWNNKPKPNQEVSNMKLEEITQGLPIMGLRVMINPEKFEQYPKKYHGMSGTITNVQGSRSGCSEVIRRYKKNGHINDSSWKVSVKFENGGMADVQVRNLIPISNNHQDIHHVYTDHDDHENYLTQKEYDAYIMKRVIMRGEKLIKDELYDDEYRRKIFDEA